MKEAMFYDKLKDNSVSCYLCPHHCKIYPGKLGMCGVRKNEKGVLKALNYGKLIAGHIDPVEKKPLYHFYPGTKIYSVASGGCNFKCGFCQNWQISQVDEEDLYGLSGDVSPEAIVKEACSTQCAGIAYTYTEPVIFFEYAYKTAQLAKSTGIKNVFVSNGFIGREALETIVPYLNAANIDLKSFRESFYAEHCRGRLKPVLDTIRRLKESGVWVEVTTLVIPGHNDSDKELSDIAGFIAGVGKDIPWHISRFHPDYNFSEFGHTSLETLRRAFEQGKAAGLRYVYLGNAGAGEDTYCENCTKAVIRRAGNNVVDNLLQSGRCCFCGHRLGGVFSREN